MYVFDSADDAKRFYLFWHARQMDAFDLTPSAVESRWRYRVNISRKDDPPFCICPAVYYASHAVANIGAVSDSNKMEGASP